MSAAQTGDDEMLKWLDVLIEFDPSEDADAMADVEGIDDISVDEAEEMTSADVGEE